MKAISALGEGEGLGLECEMLGGRGITACVQHSGDGVFWGERMGLQYGRVSKCQNEAGETTNERIRRSDIGM